MGDIIRGLLAGLDPDQIVRYAQGKKYFGYGATQLREKIRNRELPEPFDLSDTGYAKGWTGRQIIEHHRQRQELQAARAAAAKGEHNEAIRQADQALADADYARARASNAQVKKIADDMRRNIQTLRQELERLPR